MVTNLDNDYWTRLSNLLDTFVQFVRHVCPIRWTRLSNPLDTFVQFAGHVRRRKHILLFTYAQIREKESPRQSKISY